MNTRLQANEGTSRNFFRTKGNVDEFIATESMFLIGNEDPSPKMTFPEPLWGEGFRKITSEWTMLKETPESM